jgi:hypothetical protein
MLTYDCLRGALQVPQKQDQRRPRKRSRSPPEADIRASGELVIQPAAAADDDDDVADADVYGVAGEGCGLARNNSSTHVVDLVGLVSAWRQTAAEWFLATVVVHG